MSEYYYKHGQNERHGVAKRAQWLLAGLAIALPVIAVILFYFGLIFTSREAEPVTSTVQTKLQAPSIKIFRTPFFQFQASKTWSEDARETTDNRFVYRSYRGPLVEHDLTIYVNPQIQEFNATRVQPVEPAADGTLNAKDGISNHCREALPEAQKKQEVNVTFQGVRFICDGDDTIFDVLVGKVNGTVFMDLIRPDGSTGRYVIMYRDLTAEPTGRELNEVINSFQTR